MAASAEVRGILKRPFAEQVAFFRGKLGNLVPTAAWDDLWKEQHDRAFMVSGAAKADLLADLAAAVDRSITEGGSIGQFRKDFDAIVERHGWAYNGERNWRTRTIYRTNAATSYAAGRLAQLREGGFPFWMYKHGGSADPRPQHLAWDGMVLPADHPFWNTHSPPNGWGCSCRIVGVRDKDMARRLGGKPDKALPEGWNEVNAKTGEPTGIDKGWGYQPGATVADAVQQMAAKTQNWDYKLAKAYMDGVPGSQRDALARAYRGLASVATDARLYAQRVLSQRTDLDIAEFRTLGMVESRDIAALAQLRNGASMDLNGYDWAIERSAVGHIDRRHGSQARIGAGQRAVTAADYARLPDLLNDPDSGPVFSVAATGTTLPAVEVRKRFGQEELIAVFEVRGRHSRQLILKTLRVKI